MKRSIVIECMLLKDERRRCQTSSNTEKYVKYVRRERLK